MSAALTANEEQSILPTSRFSGPFDLAQAALGWATLAVVLLSVIPLGANRPVVWLLLAYVVVILFFAHVILSALRPAPVALARAAPLALLYCAVLVWGLLQILLPVPEALAHPAWAFAPEGAVPRIGADPSQGAHMVMRLATYGMIAWVMAASALNSTHAWAFFKAIAIFSALLAMYGLWATLTGRDGVFGYERRPPSFVTATFVNRNSYAFYGAMGVIVNLVVYMHVMSRRSSGGNGRTTLREFLEAFFSAGWIFALGTLLCGAAVALTTSRAGAAAAAIGLLIVLLARGRRHGTNWATLAALPVLILGFVALVLGQDTLDRFLDTGAGARLIVYAAIIEHIPDRPWLGQGIGAFHDTFRAHLPLEAASGEWHVAHSSFLENVYELGIPAAVALYFVLFIVVLRLATGITVRKSDKDIPAAALAITVAGTVHSLVDFPLQMPATAALFAAIVGIGWAQSFPREARAIMSRRPARHEI